MKTASSRSALRWVPRNTASSRSPALEESQEDGVFPKPPPEANPGRRRSQEVFPKAPPEATRRRPRRSSQSPLRRAPRKTASSRGSLGRAPFGGLMGGSFGNRRTSEAGRGSTVEPNNKGGPTAWPQNTLLAGFFVRTRTSNSVAAHELIMVFSTIRALGCGINYGFCYELRRVPAWN